MSMVSDFVNQRRNIASRVCASDEEKISIVASEGGSGRPHGAKKSWPKRLDLRKCVQSR